MKMPSKLKIMGKVFDVVANPALKTDEGYAAVGKCSAATLTIEYNPNYPQETLAANLIHEILEAIDRLNELGLSHQQISILEENLYQVLKDNRLNFSE